MIDLRDIMKKYMIIAAAALLSACNGNAPVSDADKFGLNCNVCELTLQSDTLENPYTVTFNDFGQIQEVVTSNFDGSLRFTESYVYENGKLKEIYGVNSENEDEIRYEYEYDGRFIRECRTYGMNNQEMQRWVHTNNGRHIVKTEFFLEGEPEYVTTKDFKGDAYEEKSMDMDGELLGTAHVEFFRTETKPSRVVSDDLDLVIEYNKQGLPVMSKGVALDSRNELKWLRDLDENPFRYYSYEYDERGNWISRAESVHPDSTAYAVMHRTIVYQK